MDSIYLKARAKINLTLNVLNKRNDGYHNIESVFQKIDMYDELYIEKLKDSELYLETNISEINNDENIIYKAYIELKNRYKMITGVKVKLHKRIPMQAGLGGGSTDCASFILGMNKIFELKLKEQDLIDIGQKLGSDVVPCFYDCPIKVEGKGELVTEIRTNCKYAVIIVKPYFSCSTKDMYERIDMKNNVQKINTNDMIDALEKNDIYKISNKLYNVFEEVVDQNKEIFDIKQELINNGAIGSMMSGSGSCVFGIFKNMLEARKAYQFLNKKYETYICYSYNNFKLNI